MTFTSSPAARESNSMLGDYDMDPEHRNYGPFYQVPVSIGDERNGETPADQYHHVEGYPQQQQQQPPWVTSEHQPLPEFHSRLDHDVSYESLSPAGLDQNRLPLIKAEPVPHFETQFHPRTFPRRPLTLQPTNAIDQMKLEKKRERNRLAASKCRQRKLERISTLEKQVKELQDENRNLVQHSHKLKQEVQGLREQLYVHRNQGCQINFTTDLVKDHIPIEYEESPNGAISTISSGNIADSTC